MATKQPKTAARRVKLFKNGRSQAIRIPREWELPGREAIIHKRGRRLFLEPARTKARPARKSLLDVLDSLEPLGPADRFPGIDDAPPKPVEF